MITAGNWSVTEGVLDYNPNFVRAISRQVRIAGVPLATFSPPPGVSYSAAVPDLFGLNGVPVAPFVKIPFI